MKTAISTKEIEMLQRKQELESKMVKSSKEIEEYIEIVNYFKNDQTRADCTVTKQYQPTN